MAENDQNSCMIDLATQAGEFVHSLVLMPFKSLPDVVVWGERIFLNAAILVSMLKVDKNYVEPVALPDNKVLTANAGSRPKYIEANFAWHGGASDALIKVENPQAHNPEQPDVTMCSPPGGTNFETALHNYLEQPNTHISGEDQVRIRKILDEPDSPRKRRRLVRMERAARGSLGLGMQAAIDWGSIDWTKVGAAILQVLAAILPFLVALL